MSQDAAPPQPAPQGPPPQGPPAPVGPPQPPGMLPEAPNQGKGGSKLRRALIGIVVAIVVLGGAIWLGMDEPARAKVGDCVSGASAEELQIVECTSPEAEWKVVGRVEDKPQTAMSTACQAFQSAEQAYWQGEPGKNGLVLCLAAAK